MTILSIFDPGKNAALAFFTTLLLLWFTPAISATDTEAATEPEKAQCAPYFEHNMRKLHSQEQVDICALAADKAVLVVNTASHCGYTPQFTELESLHQQYNGKGLVVIGFASNDFRQEAKDEAKTAEVCYVNYGVTFTMLAPSSVKGDNANPVFKALGSQSRAPGWNFNKYLVDRKGKVTHFGSNVKPSSEELRQSIESALTL